MILNVEFVELTSVIEVEFGEIHTVTVSGDIPAYDGKYQVTPDVDGFVLPTANHLMLQDMTVNPIPFFDVGNTSGGSTVYIGNEVI